MQTKKPSAFDLQKGAGVEKGRSRILHIRYPLHSLQARINKLQQNLRRRIIGRSEVVIEFTVIGFLRPNDGRGKVIFAFWISIFD